MTPVGFLLDEHTPIYWIAALQRADENIRIIRVGSPTAPAFGTHDSGLLRYCEDHKLVLVSCDRRMIYEHITRHTVSGHVFYGILVIDGPITTEELVSDLILIHLTNHAEDMVNVVLNLPL